MTERVTMTRLTRLARTMAKTMDIQEQSLVVCKQHSGYTLEKVNQVTGGSTYVITAVRHTKSELYELMHAYLSGYLAAKSVSK